MSIVSDPKNFPRGVTGTMSPYPTVVHVTSAHHCKGGASPLAHISGMTSQDDRE